MRPYEYRHIVTFEETNLVGNVYYVNHLRWQGHCRELFLHEHAPGVLGQLNADLALVTLHCACDYHRELFAFDEISVRMSLGELRQNRIVMKFEYWRLKNGDAELVGRGEQHIACMRRRGETLSAAPVPEDLREAFLAYTEAGKIA